jgi:hypothetical protein
VYIPKNGETFDVSVKNKRKQIDGSIRELHKHMDIDKSNNNEITAVLRDFIVINYNVLKAFTVEDLYWVCYGDFPKHEEEFKRFRELINQSPYFEPEKKRPFMFHAVSEVIPDPNDGYMEVNKMLSLAGEYFPQETGLYKKGARLDQKVTLLFFNFPITAGISLADKFIEFEEKTHWKIELNNDCNAGAAEALISSILPAPSNILKNSYYRVENVFLVTVDILPPNSKEIEEKFQKETGIILNLNIPQQNTPPIAKADKKMGQMEQNKAMQFIDTAFKNKPHKLYKKSLKTKSGESGFELSFISPSIGKLYQQEIDEIENKTYWNIWINPEINQHEIIKIAKELLSVHNVPYKKLSYFADTNSLKVAFTNDAAANSIEDKSKNEIMSEFLRLTGIGIII